MEPNTFMQQMYVLRQHQYLVMKAAEIKVEGEAVLIVTFTAIAHGFANATQMFSRGDWESFFEYYELYMWGINWAKETGILSDESIEIIREAQLDPPMNPLLWGTSKFSFKGENLNFEGFESLIDALYKVLLKEASKSRRGKSGELQKRRNALIKTLKKFGIKVKGNHSTDFALLCLCTGMGFIIGDTFTDIHGDRQERRDAGAWWISILLTQWIGAQLAKGIVTTDSNNSDQAQ